MTSYTAATIELQTQLVPLRVSRRINFGNEVMIDRQQYCRCRIEHLLPNFAPLPIEGDNSVSPWIVFMVVRLKTDITHPGQAREPEPTFIIRLQAIPFIGE